MATGAPTQQPRRSGGGGGGTGSAAAVAVAGGGGRPRPPRSALTSQLTQFDKVLNRRRSQLGRFELKELRVVHDLVSETLGLAAVAASGGSTSNRQQRRPDPTIRLPHPPPPPPTNSSASSSSSTSQLTPTQLKSNVEFALISTFYESVDRSSPRSDRQKALERTRQILGAIDCGRAERTRRRLREGTGGDGTREKAAAAKEAPTTAAAAAGAEASTGKGPSAKGATAAAATANGKTDKMGLSLSAQIDENVQDDDDDDSDDEIIILDGPPTPVKRKEPPEAVTKKANPNAAAAAAASSASSMPKEEGGGAKPKPKPNKPKPPPAAAIRKKPPRHQNTATSTPAMLRDLTVQPDTYTPTYSASLHPRPACRITFDAGYNPKSGSHLDEVALDDFTERLERWDPYWDVLHDFTVSKSSASSASSSSKVGGGGGEEKMVEWGNRTARVVKYDEIGRRTGQMARADQRYAVLSAGSVHFQLGAGLAHKLDGSHQRIRWGKQPLLQDARRFKAGEVRCLVRMLPLYKSDKDRDKDRKKRADAHLWPRGTFVQVNGKPVSVTQRKQQSHAPGEWKGTCHFLDVTALVRDVVTKTNVLEVCTRDDVPYGLQVAVCEYVGADGLFDRLTDERGGKQSMNVLSYEDGLKVALRHVDGQMVVLDDDDDGGGGGDGRQHDTVLTLSLLCPISKTPMVTPVRGVRCRHIQCFDLRTWLHSNANVSGGRWRCGVCEDFVSTSDLVSDGMFGRMLERHSGDVSGSRDKVQLRPDGSWTLMDENRLRYQGRKRSSGDVEGGGESGQAKRSRSDGNGVGGGPPPPEEIIDIG